ncbi:MAG: ABC-type transport auxiliary lipoprotein family protein [Candidatus Cloacimonadota bacterium]|nr:ABC-type transport auxiliary lipoprotein family protein [Candidatus Cloacimonadota bacterium]
MNIKKYITLLMIILIISCTKRYIARYYILDYNPQINVENQFEKPFPYNLQVKEFKIDRTYDNSRIVVRQSAHEVYYDRSSLWATRPQVAITDLLINHINKLKIVKKCEKTFLEKKPDYIISGTIHSIEKYQSERYSGADLHISIYLMDVQENQIVLTYTIERYTELYTNKMNYFSKKISDILNEEFNIFLSKVINYFKEKQG